MSPAPHDHAAPTRETLDGSVEQVLRPARGAKPAILLVRHGGHRMIVKDFAGSAWLLRQLYGRWVVARECRIYRQLEGVRGVPALRGRLDAFAFAVDYVEGHDLKRLRRGDLRAETFDRLARLFDRLHARGVVHLDAHQKTNVVLGPHGEPHLVDFATAVALGTSWLARRVLVPFLGRADWRGVLKLKARYCPDALTPDEARRWRLAYTLGWLWPHTLVRRLRRRRSRRRLAKAQGTTHPLTEAPPAEPTAAPADDLGPEARSSTPQAPAPKPPAPEPPRSSAH